MDIFVKLVYNTWQFFFTSSSTSNHLHPLQVENCDSNSRLSGAPAGIWPVVRTYDAEESGGGGYNLTVIIQSKQRIYNLFIIYITLFIIGITLSTTSYFISSISILFDLIIVW